VKGAEESEGTARGWRMVLGLPWEEGRKGTGATLQGPKLGQRHGTPQGRGWQGRGWQGTDWQGRGWQGRGWQGTGW